ncbi:unnamed protein product [Phyllotreta striolata]|uniref:Uncharacterized protein n=1 Tax=Phyllotreta striolata TaxID=444603 RepID=A0A9N9XNT2_PHYSR|nr:unnamed protein product [Phyllotreta striolata]
MNSTVVFLVLAVSTILVYGAENRTENKKFQEARLKCQEDPATRLDEEALKKSLKGDINRTKFGPHALCIYQYLGVLDKNFNVNKVELRKQLAYTVTDSLKLDAAVAECAVTKKTPKETAVEIFLCTRKVLPPYVA